MKGTVLFFWAFLANGCLFEAGVLGWGSRREWLWTRLTDE